MKKFLFLFGTISILLSIVSCTKNDFTSTPNTENLTLTKAELLSIKDDLIKSLSEDDVLDKVKEFETSSGKLSTQKSTSSTNYSIKKNFYKSIYNSVTSLKNVKPAILDSIQIYEITISDGIQEGFSLVSADKRAPCIIAYVPMGDLADTIKNRGFAHMLNLSNSVLETNIRQYNTIIDSLKEKTIKKICQAENISKEQYYEDNYAEKYSVQESQMPTKSLILIDLWKNYSPCLRTAWGQGSPYNNKVSLSCSNLPDVFGGKAPAGCVAIATGQVLTYFRKQPTNNDDAYDYDLFADYSTVPNSDIAAVEEVSQFISDIGDDVNMNYTCSGSFAYSSDAVSNVFVGKYGLSSKHLDPLYYPVSIATAFEQDQIILTRGTDPTYGGHAWVIDGAIGTGGNNIIPYYYKVHCNFGFYGTGDGWYLIASHTSGSWVSTDQISVGGYEFEDIEGWVISE